jgi:hypothetical protein
MKTSRFLALGLVLAGSLLVAVASSLPGAQQVAAAADPARPAADEKMAEPDPKVVELMETLGTVGKLTDIGRKQSSPEALLTAAFLLRKLSHTTIKDLAEKPTVEGEKDTGEALTGNALTDSYKKEMNALIDEARNMGLDRKLNLEPLIKDLETRELTRLVVGGPQQVTRSIAVNATHVYNIKAEVQRPFYFSFRASTPLRVSVVRADDNNTYAAGILPGANATWTPGGSKAIAPITIRITNVSKQPAQYQLCLQ